MTAREAAQRRPTRDDQASAPRSARTEPLALLDHDTGARASTLWWPLLTTLAVIAGAAFPLAPLRDAATGSPAAGVALALPAAYVLLAPLCDLLDMLTLLSARQHIALVVTALSGYVLWRATCPSLSRASRRCVREVGGTGAALLALAAVYVAGLLPRPVAALHVQDAGVVTVDFHSHTSASHDGRPGFTAERNREWHRAAGFDAAYVTDHRSFDGARAGELGNPRRAGEGTTLLSGIETRFRGQHINVLGVDARTGDAFLPGGIGAVGMGNGIRKAAGAALVMLTVPSTLATADQIHASSPGAVAMIELSNAAPRGLGQSDSARVWVLRLADSLDLAVVAGSDNHGWGRTAAAWSLLTIPGWRSARPDSLGALIENTIRTRRRGAVRVVERARPQLSSLPTLAAIVPAAAWTMLTGLSGPERLSWLAWIWGLAVWHHRLVRRQRAGVVLIVPGSSSGTGAAGPRRPRRAVAVSRAGVRRVGRIAKFGIATALGAALHPAGVSAQATTADSVPAASISVHVRHARLPVAGAVVRAGRVGALSDEAGNATLHLAAVSQTIVVSRLGFRADTLHVLVQPARDTDVVSELTEEAATLAAVVVAASRVERRLEDEPERVEVLAGEDVGEKTVMRPANPTVLFSEMPGVRVQASSPALGGAGVRVQGLRGRYSLLLADGLPLYGSASEGLAFLQIPPLDLAQVEVIKGAATALYGAAAGGGVLNLVSRRPPGIGARADRELLVNQTSRQGTDALARAAGRISDQWRYTLLAGAHRQVASDADGDGWSDIPAFRRAELRPRAFWTGAGGSSAMITLGAADERRTGGTIGGAVAPDGAPFRVSANTRRADIGTVVHLVTGHAGILTVRASANRQSQDRQMGDSSESDRRGTGFAEATFARVAGAHQALAGVGVQADALSGAALPDAEYRFVTTSLFGQDTYSVTDRVSISATARLDRHSRYGTFLSPRVSALARLATGWAARVSAGTGFFAPTPLVEETEAVGLARVRGFGRLEAERIASASFDLTRTVGPLEINGTLFRTEIEKAVEAREDQPFAGALTLVNSPTTRTGGAELFAVYNREPLAVTALYAYTRSNEWSPDEGTRVEVPLTPRDAAGLDIAFEEDESGTRVGLEVFHTGRQALADNPYRATSVPYTTIGLLAEQRVGTATLFVNAENVGNVRQTRYDPLLLPSRSGTGRWTTDQWAPLEGRTINAGLRLRFQ